MRRDVAALTVVFCGLAVAFSGLSLAALGRPAAALAAAIVGAVIALVGVLLLPAPRSDTPTPGVEPGEPATGRPASPS